MERNGADTLIDTQTLEAPFLRPATIVDLKLAPLGLVEQLEEGL